MKPIFVQESGIVLLEAGDQLPELMRFKGQAVTLTPIENVFEAYPQLEQVLTHPDILARFRNPREFIEQRCAIDHLCCGELVPVQAKDGTPAWLCWHHDNQHRRQELGRIPSQKKLLAQNIAKCIAIWGGTSQLSLSTLCWWALVNKVFHCIPIEIQYAAAHKTKAPERVHTGIGWRETDERFKEHPPLVANDPLMELRETIKAKRAIKTIDPEPPAIHMARPKLQRFTNEAYLDFVRQLPCVVTGTTNSEAHHLIGHGHSGMGTKSHDLLTFPLSTEAHRELHQDPKAWERQHGSQLEHVLDTLSKACGLGVFG